MRPKPGKDAPAIAEIVDAFYRVRTGHDYGYGHGDFDLSNHAGAVAAAKEQIKPLIYGGKVTDWIKVSLEERWIVRYVNREAMGETVAVGTERSVGKQRVELTPAEKTEILSRPEYAAKLKTPA